MNSQNAMQDDTVRSWKAYTADPARDAGPVRAVELEDELYGGMLKPQTYVSCMLQTGCTECSYGDIC